MRLTTGDAAFELQILGYEYPDEATDSVNWLFVEGLVRHPRGDWGFRHPSLDTREVHRLADWLQAVALGTEWHYGQSFTEPNLRFDVLGEGAARTLRVTFAAEASPPWVEAREGAYVEFPLSSLELGPAVEYLRQRLRLYPTRAVDEDEEE